MTDKTTFDTAALDAKDRAKLLSGLVVPRPIGWIGTRGAAGDNLAPFSFFNLVVTTPPTLMFSPGMSVRVKDTLANVRETGVFTVNVVTDGVAAAMNVTSADYPPGVDEFEVAGLAKAEAESIDAPLVSDARAGFECRVTDLLEVGEGPAATVVFGHVLRIHVDADLLDGTRILFDRLGAVGRLAGPWYSRSDALFEMERPSP